MISGNCINGEMVQGKRTSDNEEKATKNDQNAIFECKFNDPMHQVVLLQGLFQQGRFQVEAALGHDTFAGFQSVHNLDPAIRLVAQFDFPLLKLLGLV